MIPAHKPAGHHHNKIHHEPPPPAGYPQCVALVAVGATESLRTLMALRQLQRSQWRLVNSVVRAVREFPLRTGFAGYLLFVDRKAIGAVEAKPAGLPLSGRAVVWSSRRLVNPTTRPSD
ncbi:MAG: hypothetical protein ACE5LU_03020 [Anaerolineae bacterium]